MALHGIAQFIDALDSRIGSSIKSDTVIGAVDVIIDGGRNADHIDAVLTQRSGTAEGAVDEGTKPTDADLATSVTIAIGGFQALIAKAAK